MKNLILSVLLTVAMLYTPMAMKAQAAENASSAIPTITTKQLHTLWKSGEDMTIINTLSPIEFRDQAIPGSINLPYEYLKEGLMQLPADKGRMLVIYCQGPS